MQQFIGKINLQEYDNSRWSLLSDFSYENNKYIITCGTNFITDGASIPKVMWSIIGSPMERDLLKPAIIHDGLYTIMSLDRHECDDLLKEMLLFNKVPEEKIFAIYEAVHLFGGTHWEKDSSDQAQLITITIK